ATAFLRTAGRDAPGRIASPRGLAILNPYAIPSSTRRVTRPPCRFSRNYVLRRAREEVGDVAPKLLALALEIAVLHLDPPQ
ncbi:hypothetical protein RZS08_13065, partial [Arthrospira platensis SPKY1]|nr:hypothetical protein [Arthrospira platensis SPKY1]